MTVMRSFLTWFDRVAHRPLKFAIIGSLGYAADVTVFNLLRYAGDPGLLQNKPLTAKFISAVVATTITFFGNRHWTWRHRERQAGRAAVHRQYILFLGFSAVGAGISLLCLFVSHYMLDLRTPLADNISANGVGLLLGTIFRYWSYSRFVFRDSQRSSAVVGAAPR
jgi:putative flippase GtrA